MLNIHTNSQKCSDSGCAARRASALSVRCISAAKPLSSFGLCLDGLSPFIQTPTTHGQSSRLENIPSFMP